MFNINYLELFKNFPSELTVILISLLPIAEPRVSLPIAINVYKMNLFEAFFWSITPSIIMIGILIYCLEPIYKFFSKKFKLVNLFFDWLFKRTRKNFSEKFEIWGPIALIIFVAIPFPLTGFWTGAVAAWIFNIPREKAWLYVSLGVIISATIVSLATMGIIRIF